MDKIQKDIIKTLEQLPERLHAKSGSSYITKENGRIKGCALGAIAISRGIKKEPYIFPIGPRIMELLYPKISNEQAKRISHQISIANGHAESEVVPLKQVAKKLKTMWATNS